MAMTKKVHASMKPGLSMRHVLCIGWKLVIVVSLALCLLAFLRIQQYSQSMSSSFPSTKSRILRHHQFTGHPKIAFLFLVRRNLPLDFLWESFFEVGDFFFIFLLRVSEEIDWNCSFFIFWFGILVLSLFT